MWLNALVLPLVAVGMIFAVMTGSVLFAVINGIAFGVNLDIVVFDYIGARA